MKRCCGEWTDVIEWGRNRTGENVWLRVTQWSSLVGFWVGFVLVNGVFFFWINGKWGFWLGSTLCTLFYFIFWVIVYCGNRTPRSLEESDITWATRPVVNVYFNFKNRVFMIFVFIFFFFFFFKLLKELDSSLSNTSCHSNWIVISHMSNELA